MTVKGFSFITQIFYTTHINKEREHELKNKRIEERNELLKHLQYSIEKDLWYYNANEGVEDVSQAHLTRKQQKEKKKKDLRSKAITIFNCFMLFLTSELLVHSNIPKIQNCGEDWGLNIYAHIPTGLVLFWNKTWSLCSNIQYFKKKL